MQAKQLIRENLELADTMTAMLFEGLSDQEILVRAAGGQSRQLDVGPSRRQREYDGGLGEAGRDAPLPANFCREIRAKNAPSDDQKGWVGKDELLRPMREQSAGTVKALDAMTDAELVARGPKRCSRSSRPTPASSSW